MKVLFGMALRQTAGFVESLLRLAGLDWTGKCLTSVPSADVNRRSRSTFRIAAQMAHYSS